MDVLRRFYLRDSALTNQRGERAPRFSGFPRMGKAVVLLNGIIYKKNNLAIAVADEKGATFRGKE